MRAPEIRFKQYKEKWGSIVLKEIGQTYSGLTGKVKEDFGIGNGLYIPFLNVLVNPQIDISNLQKVKIRFDEKQNKVHKGDILFNTSSETPEEVGLCSVFTSDIENVYLNSFCFGFRLTNSLINSSYIVYLLRSSLGRELMMILAQGATRYNLSKKSFLDSQIRIPESLQEQQKIASYFQSLDSLIQTTSKELASLKQIKAASLQSMFPQEGETVPKVRFKGFKGEWERCSLGSLSMITKGEQINKLDLYTINKYYVLNGGIAPSGYTNKYNTEANTISISEGGNSCGYVNFNNEKFWSGGHNYTLQKVKINNYYLYSFLKNNEASIMSKRVGSGLPNIQKKSLTDFLITYPSLKEEQQKIASYFCNLDKQISLQAQRLEKLKQIKAACLDKMFV